MIISNEPGYYEDGQYGIRIESLVIVKEAKPPNDFLKKGWLEFERVTMVRRIPSLRDITRECTDANTNKAD